MQFADVISWILVGAFLLLVASTRIVLPANGLDGHQDRGLLAFISPTVREPVFDSHLSRVITTEGQEADLPCSVDNLNKLKVVWLDSNSVTLTLGERRIVDDTRFSVRRPQQSSWNLVIKDTRSTDAGRYLCAVNTHPIKNKMVELTVKVPAKILETGSSKDQIVREGSDVSVTCRTSGVPRPVVTWSRKWRQPPDSQQRRNDPMNPCVYVGSSPRAEGYRVSKTGEHILGAGEFLAILNISRRCSDIYECTAQNEISPAVSREIGIQVEFAPEISPISRKISQAIGKETILECEAKAFPHAINYWEKEGSRLKNSEKYRIEAYNGAEADLLVLSLRIFNLERQDFGAYNCIAANSLGKDRATVLLEEYELHPTVHHHQASSSPAWTTEEGQKGFLQSKVVTSTWSSSFPVQQRMEMQQKYQPRLAGDLRSLHTTVRGRNHNGFKSSAHLYFSNLAPYTAPLIAASHVVSVCGALNLLGSFVI